MIPALKSQHARRLRAIIGTRFHESIDLSKVVRSAGANLSLGAATICEVRSDSERATGALGRSIDDLTVRPHTEELPNDDRRLRLRQKYPCSVGSVDRRNPYVSHRRRPSRDGVEQPAIVEPLDLVVDVARFRADDALGVRLQIEDVQTPGIWAR